MEGNIVARRIYRPRGSTTAFLIGKPKVFARMHDLFVWTRKHRKVMVYQDKVGNQGIVRSGRKMRAIDLHVRNAYPAFEELTLTQE